jgi:hypothetical protein
MFQELVPVTLRSGIRAFVRVDDAHQQLYIVE